MKSKYEGYSRRGSSSWRSIKKHIPLLRQHAVWVFGDGATSVDKVLAVFDILPTEDLGRLTVAQAISSGRLSDLRNLLPEHSRDSLDFAPNGTRDKIVWSYNASGSFSVKTFLHLTRPRAPSILSHVWHAWIPPKVSMLAWKVGKGAIPTDDRITSLGIQMASRCVCCSSPSCETIEHLFIHGDLARSVWDHFGQICRKPKAHTIFQLFKFWVIESNTKSQFGIISTSIFLWSLWEIWKIRNKARHDEPSDDILRIILYNVNIHTANIVPQAKGAAAEKVAIQALHMTVKAPLCKPKAWVAWHPGNGITANFDVSSDAKKGSTVLRDSSGSFIYGLVVTFEYTCRFSNLLSLMVRTLESCATRSITLTNLQISSKSVWRWLRIPSTNFPWPMTTKLRICRNAIGNAEVGYVPKAVNCCANKMLKCPPGNYDLLRSLQSEVKACIRLDAEGVPYCVRGSDLNPD